MIKKILLGSIKIGAVLLLGQFPLGNSTLGAEFLKKIKTGCDFVVGPKFTELMNGYLAEVSAVLRNRKIKAEIPESGNSQLKAWVPPEAISKEESEAVQAILEREL